MTIEDIIKNAEQLDSDEKKYWLDILPIMTKYQKELLIKLILKTEDLKEFNLDFMINYKEKDI